MATAAAKREKRKALAAARIEAGQPYNPKGGRPRKAPTGNPWSGRAADRDVNSRKIKSVAVKARMRHSLDVVARGLNDAERRVVEAQMVELKKRNGFSKSINDLAFRANKGKLDLRDTGRGLNEYQAGGQLAGSVLGMMRLRNHITEAEYEAGKRYGEDMDRYYLLSGIGRPTARAQDVGRVKGLGSDPSVRAVQDAANKMMLLEGILGQADVNGRPVTTLVKRVCISDEEHGVWQPHMIGHLRRGLMALSKHYKTDDNGGEKPLHPFK